MYDYFKMTYLKRIFYLKKNFLFSLVKFLLSIGIGYFAVYFVRNNLQAIAENGQNERNLAMFDVSCFFSEYS